ncbi:hypothetical protein [Flavobacterium sp. N1719]|uniref:hypothetical protein n=1 Tax=Flavobacterium sp. N1719 TaxID=2885633 RepID=UPI0022217591|nr:hypothetical protein [Flavobacterium sp. N1719]
MTKVLKSNRTITEDKKLLGRLINNHLKMFPDKKKTLEICHTGKFLLFFENMVIHQVTEKPDFILFDGTYKIGLEHQIIVDFESKEREGFFENIFELVEKDLNDDVELLNFLAGCYIVPFVNFKLKDKEYLVETIKKVIKEYVINNNFIENPIIEHIYVQPHSQKNIYPNFGGWWQKKISLEIIENSIKKKNDKIAAYKERELDTHWLLLVIGGLGESSFEMDKTLELKIETEFDKVFVLEDFNNVLYELK